MAYERMIWETTYFELMLIGHDVSLPVAARLMAAHHLQILRVLFGVSALLIVAKEPFLRDKRLSLIVTLALALLVLVLAGIMRAMLTYPLQRSVVGFA
jgi:hypothetical protein